MPRSLDQIAAHAEKLANEYPGGKGKDARALRELRKAVLASANAELEIARLVGVAREAGHTWAAIAGMLGTSKEAAIQRYGQRIKV